VSTQATEKEQLFMISLTEPEILITIAIFVGGLALAGWMIMLEKRPTDLTKQRLAPTTPLMFLGVFISLLALVHILNLYGVKTGR
jgi:hypothetical protein